jgi:TolB-like protein
MSPPGTERLDNFFRTQQTASMISVDDKERHQRIAALIDDLEARYKQTRQKPANGAAIADRPLSIAFLGLKHSGVRAGDFSETFDHALMRHLQTSKRVVVLERSLIEPVLRELRLSSSTLAEPDTALSLGRLIGARFILTGNVITTEPETMVSIRVIETETSRIICALTECADEARSASALAKTLARMMAERLEHEFPEQG